MNQADYVQKYGGCEELLGGVKEAAGSKQAEVDLIFNLQIDDDTD